MRCGKTTRLWLIHSVLSSCLSWWVPSVRDKLNCNVVLSRKRNNQEKFPQSRWVSRMWPPGRVPGSAGRKGHMCYQDLIFLVLATVLRTYFLLSWILLSLSFFSPISILPFPPTPLTIPWGKESSWSWDLPQRLCCIIKPISSLSQHESTPQKVPEDWGGHF